MPICGIHNVFNTYIKTHGSESRGQEEAAVRDERVSYLHEHCCEICWRSK